LHFSTNRRDHFDIGFWFKLYLRDSTINIYSFPALEIKGMEYQEHDSFVKPDLTSAIDYTGTGPLPVRSANIANITIAIYIPWFLRG